MYMEVKDSKIADLNPRMINNVNGNEQKNKRKKKGTLKEKEKEV
uniref:Uncharacterized protein n=1 Tax=Onchocerca volvulus TaxID=6282 RepID=A0A8R1TWR1_ONCVO